MNVSPPPGTAPTVPTVTAAGDDDLIDGALTAAIVEHAEDAIIAKRLDGTVIRWNAGAEKVFGYSAADMLGGPITRLCPPELLQEEAELVGRLQRGEAVEHFSTRRIRKDGQAIDVSVSLSPVRNAAGKIIAVSKIARDVTGLHRRQIMLALSSAIIQHSDDAIMSIGLDGTVMTWNPGAEQMFGYSSAEMTGGPSTRLFPADRLQEEAGIIAQLQLGRKVSHFESRRVRKDGEHIDVSITLSAVRDSEGKIIAISKIARDITERKQQFARDAEARELQDKNERLEKSNGDLEEFAYIASHDLKTPLSGINSAALWLEEDLNDSLSEESRKLLVLMRSRINRMEALLDDLLAYSRVGRQEAAVGEASLAALFGNVIAVLGPPPHMNVRIEGELPIMVKASAQLEQVLRNLVNNAFKHHDKPTGEVVVSVKRAGSFAEITVGDDGPGIEPQYHKKIFQLFQTLKRRDEVEGTGMGLAIVRKLIERQNCRISVHSEGNGTGTQFRFRWPALAAADIQGSAVGDRASGALADGLEVAHG